MAPTKISGPTFPANSKLNDLSGRPIQLEGARLWRDGSGPLFLTAPLEGGGFIAYLIRGNGGVQIAAVGHGEADVTLLRAHFPVLTGHDVTEMPLPLVFPAALHSSFEVIFLDLVQPKEFAASDWECTDIVFREQDPEWCIPTCLSMLAPRVDGKKHTPKSFADRWGQGKGEPFDDEVHYKRFKKVCAELKFKVVVPRDHGGFHPLTWSMLSKSKRPLLLALAGGHAEVCAGICSYAVTASHKTVHGILVYNPAEKGQDWYGMPPEDELQVRFAWAGSGAVCPGGIIS